MMTVFSGCARQQRLFWVGMMTVFSRCARQTIGSFLENVKIIRSLFPSVVRSPPAVSMFELTVYI